MDKETLVSKKNKLLDMLVGGGYNVNFSIKPEYMPLH